MYVCAKFSCGHFTVRFKVCNINYVKIKNSKKGKLENLRRIAKNGYQTTKTVS